MTKLENMLKYVSEHNEFYKKRIKEFNIKDPLDIRQWPVLTRRDLQKNRYNMFSSGFKSKFFNQELLRQSSSGTSGVPVNVYWDYKDWYASNMSLWRKRSKWYEIYPTDKCVIFTLHAFNIKNEGDKLYYIKEPENLLSVNISLIQTTSGYDKLLDIISDFEPRWFYIQPFVLNRIIQAYKRTGKIPPKTLKHIESVGEILSSDLRKKAKDLFGVDVVNLYGSEEMNGIAYECPKHHMHVLEDNVFLEVMNKDGIVTNGVGQTIITSINNYAMPLIRYNQGDLVITNTPKVVCDNNDNHQIIDLIKGRQLETVILDNGIEISSFMLLEMMAEVNNRFKDLIEEYHFQYSNTDNLLRCIIRLNSNVEKWQATIKKEIGEVFCQKLVLTNNCNFIVEATEEKQLENKKYSVLTIE